MKLLHSRALAAAGLLFLVIGMAPGCSDEDEPEPRDIGGDLRTDADDAIPGTSRGSCSSAAGCLDYVGSMWTSSLMESNCGEVPDSTFSTSPCPTTNLVGSCGVNMGGPGEFITRYYSPMFTAATAEDHCNLSGGTWIP